MRKEIIIKAATNIIHKEGVNHFTLAAVAEEAGLSKGGLLYHFESKDALIIAMNQYVLDQFRQLLANHKQEGNSFHKAYVLATKDFIAKHTDYSLTASFIASITGHRPALELWKNEYVYFDQQLSEEKYPAAVTLLVKTVCDGLWFGPIFQLSSVNYTEIADLTNYLLQLLEREQEV